MIKRGIYILIILQVVCSCKYLNGDGSDKDKSIEEPQEETSLYKTENSGYHFQDGYYNASMFYKKYKVGGLRLPEESDSTKNIEIKIENDQIIQFSSNFLTYRKGDPNYSWDGGYVSKNGRSSLISSDGKYDMEFYFIMNGF